MVPIAMAWFGKTFPEICALIKDSGQTDGLDLAEVAEHVQLDELADWDWAPGKGREPAPLSADELYEAINLWNAAGASCPAN
jgi:hypothetical protein